MTGPSYSLALSEEELSRYRFMAERARAAEADLWTAAGISAGASVADVGCGPGAVAAAMAQVVGPSGHVVGVDADERAVAAARLALQAVGAEPDVTVGRADSTGLPGDRFDVVVLRHVLAHNGGAEERIVRHLAWLARPGGAVYVVDVDLTAFRIRPLDPDLADMFQRYERFHADRGNDLSVGLRLSALLETAGLTVAAYRGWFEIYEVPRGHRLAPLAAGDAMIKAGAASPADLRRWELAQERLDRQEVRPLMFTALFAAIGRRPD